MPCNETLGWNVSLTNGLYELQLVLRGLCAGLDEDAPCYAVLLSVHDRERGGATPATPLGPGGASLPAKAKHSNRCAAD